MFKNRPVWVRALEGTNDGASGAAGSAPEGSSDGEETPPAGEQNPAEGSSEKEATDGENPDGRGSKQAVLADLARERDKRQELEAKIAEFEKAEEERKRSEMTELEKLQADLEKERAEKEKMLAELSKRDLARTRDELASEFNIPAAMAGRITGGTPEEMRADAEALAKALGPYNGPSDPSAGRGNGTSKPATLEAAIAAKYQ
ncbi:capsid assembly scaffolding protein Gp46 family protein [Corynebacterium sp. H113]|uniref:capsid assembly scaffolding protein Gp46 family protein n=1 Tax=Corynebacterium sp. H113 TaxID=3133419 RepID=UPI0030A6A240